MWLRVMAPQSVVTKVCGSTVWLVVGSACVGRVAGTAGGSLGSGRILVSRLKRTLCGVGGAGCGVGVGFAGAVRVVVGVEGDEVEELLDVGGDVGVDEVLVFCEGYGYG